MMFKKSEPLSLFPIVNTSSICRIAGKLYGATFKIKSQLRKVILSHPFTEWRV